jgi:hypothetical protein
VIEALAEAELHRARPAARGVRSRWRGGVARRPPRFRQDDVRARALRRARAPRCPRPVPRSTSPIITKDPAAPPTTSIAIG